MKIKIGITLSLLIGIIYGQSIQETLEQISALKAEISQSEDLVEKKIADMKPMVAVSHSKVNYLH